MRTPREQAAAYRPFRLPRPRILGLAIILLLASPAVAAAPPQVCFTPGGQCPELVVREIAEAQHQTLVGR